MLQFIRVWPEDEAPRVILPACQLKVHHLGRILLVLDLGLHGFLLEGVLLLLHPEEPAVDIAHPVLGILDDIALVSEGMVAQTDLLRDGSLAFGGPLLAGLVAHEIVLLLREEQVGHILIRHFVLLGLVLHGALQLLPHLGPEARELEEGHQWVFN